MKLKFIGATEGVTGSKHLIITNKGKQVLLDCGMFQGMGKETEELNRHLGVNPEDIEAVLLSHAHIDHSGNLPLLVKLGFKGRIYCTEATFDVCEILLMDSAHIHESDVRFINKRRTQNSLPPIKPLYTVKEAENCLKHFKPIPFNTEFFLNDEISFNFSEVGHITGAAAINITSHENENKTKLTFTGDVGRYNDLILKAPQAFPQADYIICESTYGDRLHDKSEDAEKKLLEVVTRTCVEKKGKLIIPAFSLGRTQEIVFVLDKLKSKGLLPSIKIFVDSPLSSKATDIVRNHPECFNDSMKAYTETDPDPFGFSNLKYIQEASESKELNDLKEPCIIISASGMCDAGRVKHHLRYSIEDPRNTVLMVGYCSPNTLGAKLASGSKQVRIFGDFFNVNADVDVIQSYSAHADYNELLKFLSCQNSSKLKTVFLVHGEDDAKKAFKETLQNNNYHNIVIPGQGDIFELY